MKLRNLIISLFVLILLASIPVSVYLVSQQQSLKSEASTPVMPQSLEIITSSNTPFATSSQDVVLKINYFDKNLTPSKVRVANFLEELNEAEEVPFSAPSIEVPWTLPPEKTSHTVYAQFFINNKWQSPISNSIILN